MVAEVTHSEGGPRHVQQTLACGMQRAVFHQHNAIGDVCEVGQGQERVVALHNDLTTLIGPAQLQQGMLWLARCKQQIVVISTVHKWPGSCMQVDDISDAAEKTSHYRASGSDSSIKPYSHEALLALLCSGELGCLSRQLASRNGRCPNKHKVGNAMHNFNVSFSSCAWPAENDGRDAGKSVTSNCQNKNLPDAEVHQERGRKSISQSFCCVCTQACTSAASHALQQQKPSQIVSFFCLHSMASSWFKEFAVSVMLNSGRHLQNAMLSPLAQDKIQMHGGSPCHRASAEYMFRPASTQYGMCCCSPSISGASPIQHKQQGAAKDR